MGIKKYEVKRQDWMTKRIHEIAQLEEVARQDTAGRQEQGGSKALIAVKAQHPLTSDGKPGPEYEQRLQMALKVRADIISAHPEMMSSVDILVFGGEHAGNDDVTLATAGRQWLIEHLVAPERIKEIIVYSGNDEDTFAAQRFAQDEEYGELHVVCSLGQIPRCLLNYVLAGWWPTLHPITFVDAPPHQSLICELTGGWAVPAYLKDDNDAVEKATESIRQRHAEEREQQKQA